MIIRNKIALITGAITIIITCIVSFLCIDDWSGMTGAAFATILWSEIVFFGGLVLVEWIAPKTEQIITRGLVYTIITAYSAINLVLSIIYISVPFFKEASTSFTIIQVVMLAIAVISMTFSILTSKAVRQANDQTMNAIENAEDMINRLNKLAVCPQCERYASTLKKLSEDLRYTDISKIVAEDTEISYLISIIEVECGSIEDSSEDKIKSTLAHLNSLVSKRKISSSIANKGKI